MSSKKDIKYDETNIQVLGFIKGCQKRPGVYIGSAGSAGLLHLAGEVYTNSIDEFIAGRNNWVGVETDGRKVTVADNGPGIPVGNVKDQETGKTVSSLTAIMTKAHAGGKLDSKAYGGVSGGLNGIGLTAVNALSKHVEVFSFREGSWHKQTFSLGVPTSKVLKCKAPAFNGVKRKLGTVVSYVPEPKFFEEDAKLSLKLLKERLSQASYINGGLKIELKTPKNHYKFFQKEGLKSLVEKLAEEQNVTVISKSMHFIKTHIKDKDIKTINCALCWTENTEHTIQSYVNSVRTIDGGTHVNGFYAALNEAFKPYRGKRSKFKIEDLLSGLIVAINVSVDQPEYTSQTKDKLSKTKVQKEVQSVVLQELDVLFSKNKGLIKEIVRKANELYKLREEFAQNKKALAGLNSPKNRIRLPEKLANCTTKDRDKAECFLVEGTSAAGTATKARDSEFQAVLELKGKLLNAYTANPAKILESDEIRDILVSIGYSEDSKKPLNFGKIVLLMDADEDGCLPSETEVLTLDGENLKIGDIYRNWKKQHKGKLWVWGRKDSEAPMTPVLATNIVKVSRNRFIRITLDDGTVYDCTRNHGWIINDNGVERRIKAKELRKGDSLPAVFLQNRYSDGRILQDDECAYTALMRPWSLRAMSRYNPESNPNTPTNNEGWPLTVDKMLHHIAFKHFNPKSFKIWKKSNVGINGGAYHIHHIDKNGCNNAPNNLELLKMEKHRALHAKEWSEIYNGSEKHLNDLRLFRQTDKGKKQSKAFLESAKIYNKSQKNKDSTVALNKNTEVRELQTLGRYVRKYLLLQKLGLELNEHNWNRVKAVDNIANMEWKKIEYTAREIIDAVKPHHKPIKQRKEKISYPTQARAKFLATCQSTISNYGELNENNYEKNRRNLNQLRNPKWSTGLKLFNNSIKDLLQYFNKEKTTNHKIVKVQHLRSKNPRPYFCLEVPETSNFYIKDINGNGVVTGNSHIQVLASSLFKKLLPRAFKEKRIFIVKAQLFNAEVGDKTFYGDSLKEVQDKVGPKIPVNRVKGWGALPASKLEEIAFNAKTRQLTCITDIVGKEEKEYEKLVGSDTNYRKKLLGIQVAKTEDE